MLPTFHYIVLILSISHHGDARIVKLALLEACTYNYLTTLVPPIIVKRQHHVTPASSYGAEQLHIRPTQLGVLTGPGCLGNASPLAIQAQQQDKLTHDAEQLRPARGMHIRKSRSQNSGQNPPWPTTSVKLSHPFTFKSVLLSLITDLFTM